MDMTKIKHDLTTGSGYVVLEKIIPEELINKIINRLPELIPVRASSKNKKYAERGEIKTLPDISVWWSQIITEWDEVQRVNDIVQPFVKEHMNTATLYASDIVVIEPNTSWMNPHIDTPYRFKKYNYDKRLLGIQSIISLFDLDQSTAVTGVVPKSQLSDFNINLCYQGIYNDWFTKNYVQPCMPKGSVLFYNCRLMHSSMPNPQQVKRPALLLNYLDNDIIEDIKKIDNIWNSNEYTD
jgi:ectoine hydroxylase-related dioxygenase (phytanoyl-CoA dioxygenase family)